MAEPAAGKFEPEYAAHQRRVSAQAGLGWILFLLAIVVAVMVSDISFGRLSEGAGKLGDFIRLMLPHLDTSHLLDNRNTEGSIAYWYYAFPSWLRLIWESVEIAILATALGFTGAFFFSFPAARNLGVGGGITWLTRRFLELSRTVPELVTALILVFAFGTGPLAGVLAIAMHTTGALGKLFSEVHENAGSGPMEGVAAAGGSWPEIMRFGLVPQVMPNLISYALLRFEINVAAATAIGIVGAGGIGMELRKVLDLLLYPDALAIILMIVALIFVIDFTSERVRTLFLGELAKA